MIEHDKHNSLAEAFLAGVDSGKRRSFFDERFWIGVMVGFLIKWYMEIYPQ
tara:strand:- start:249 stop:401 length:153 start_codon:yes stop_codon:yes gene_type:complete